MDLWRIIFIAIVGNKSSFKYNIFCCCCSVTCVQLFVSPWTAACQASLSFTISWSLLKLMSVQSVIPSIHLILYWPLLLLPSIFPSIGVFSYESALHIRWPKYSASASVLLMSIQGRFPLGLTGLISLQSKGFSGVFSSTTIQKALILQCSAFFMVQFSHLNITTGETITLTETVKSENLAFSLKFFT